MRIPYPILIVEDDVDDQFFIKTICEKIGIVGKLVFLSNGKEALHYLRTTDQSPFIILCDINMPVMNGLELRKHINEDEFLRRKSIPFVFFSTAARPAEVITAYDMTVQGFFVKDTSMPQMQETISLIFEYWLKCQHPNTVKP